MCDYSLQHVKSRPAAIGDKLTTKNFGTGTIGFASAEDCDTAVCVLPGTELAFDAPPVIIGATYYQIDLSAHQDVEQASNRLAIFRQIDKEHARQHHDALEFPDGSKVKLTLLQTGQTATVLQLPAAPKTKQEADEQTRVEYAG